MNRRTLEIEFLNEASRRSVTIVGPAFEALRRVRYFGKDRCARFVTLLTRSRILPRDVATDFNEAHQSHRIDDPSAPCYLANAWSIGWDSLEVGKVLLIGEETVDAGFWDNTADRAIWLSKLDQG